MGTSPATHKDSSQDHWLRPVSLWRDPPSKPSLDISSRKSMVPLGTRHMLTVGDILNLS